MRRPLALALVVGLGSTLVMSSGSFADSTTTSSTSTTAPSTTTTTKHQGSVAPLTGLPYPKRLLKDRSALTIKIDNTPEAMPQYGVNEADVVYEEIVEGGITRLAAIFNSKVPTVVGPVRSVRRTDREIVFPIGGVFAFSGGAEYAVRSIETAPVKLYDESNAGAAMFRNASRAAPHNLFANAELLMDKDGKPRPPTPLFTYLSSGTHFGGPKVKSFVVNFASGYEATYTWDTKTKSWDRTLFGAPEVTASGARVSPTNVIVMTVNYVGGVGVIDSYAQLIGSGHVEVFSGGRVAHGTWVRPNLRHAAIYRNLQGKVINLTPGQTWVELLSVGEGVSITPGS
ncbi:MAG TPA: DUF3048 domain-containing protein [Acidimicrobiales bacterium]|jgi:hypothetical protein|nr:DUF3048 domain-containing protein [Acidimicrobiales bacterium]